MASNTEHMARANVDQRRAAAEEGITLNVQDIVNINKTVPESGQTLFLAQ
jgi:hypothetical protein